MTVLNNRINNNMKVKLLKKVRKQFNITRYDDVKGMPTSWIYRDTPTPFYLVEDITNPYITDVFDNYEDAYKRLLLMIEVVHGDKRKIKPHRIKSEKLWYNDNKK